MLRQKWFRALFRRRVLVIVLLLIQLLFFVYVITSSSLTSTIVSAVLRFVSLAVSIYVISRKEKGIYKLTWVFMILMFPILGGISYLIFTFQSSTKRFKKKIDNSKEKTKGLFTLSGDCYDEAITKIPEFSQHIRYLQNYEGFPIYNDSKVTYLPFGEVKFEHILTELEKAEKYIFLEYFIVQEGKMWNSILEILKRKAAEGVKIRLLYDDFGCFMLLPKDYPKQLKKYGIECAVFNPFRPFFTAIQNNRDHRKILSIDGKVAFTGGINLADEYINAIEKHGHWKDVSVNVEGKAAWSFTLMFLQMWEVTTASKEDYMQYFPGANKFYEKTDGFVIPYADSPMDTENVGENVYKHILNNAKDFVYICTPYLIVGDNMMSALCLAAKSGVDVRIITPHIADKRPVHATTRSYYRELIRAGVKIYEYTNGFIHSKTFVSDDRVATVGTTNLDFRSLYLHFECGAWMYDSEAVLELKEDFLKTLEICQPITSEDCKGNLFKRTVQDFLRIFAPFM